jgi:ubiquinone/menaquinone biosynthesis C-methylase UbiE
MSESPYDAYPYPEPGRYPADQIKNLRIDTAPRSETWEQWFPGETPRRKEVLVVGCGVYEALAVAAQEPLLYVLGVDASRQVFQIARETAQKAEIANVTFMHGDFLKMDFQEERFDIVCASGVLHHIPGVGWKEIFVEKARHCLKAGGLFVVMVYGDQYRYFVPDFCHMLRMLGVKRDPNGIAFVRGLIAALPDHHPVKHFYAGVTDYDAQIADLWLHPYFRQYGADEFLALMEDAGFSFVRWIEPRVTDCSLLKNLPPEHKAIEDRLARLSFREQARVGQILNHADVKLATVFAK